MNFFELLHLDLESIDQQQQVGLWWRKGDVVSR